MGLSAHSYNLSTTAAVVNCRIASPARTKRLRSVQAESIVGRCSTIRVFPRLSDRPSMIDPKRVLRALAEHWTLLEPLCERFDSGTLSLIELRKQLTAQ